MKLLSALFFLLIPSLCFAQADTDIEVFLFDLTFTNGTYAISNPVNISDNPGYDSQPSFTPDGKGVLFSSTRNGQTDAVLYSIEDKSKQWLSNSPGGEYSPTVMPGGTHFSTIILKPDGEQLLWKYPLDGSGVAEVVVPELVIGYHTWFDQHTLFSFVLGDPATLQKNDISTQTNTIIANNPGRSLHRIPNSLDISYVDKSNADSWIIKAYTPETGTISDITETLDGAEDMAWSAERRVIFMGADAKLFTFDPNGSDGWIEIADLSKWNLSGITRVAINADESKLAIVVNK